MPCHPATYCIGRFLHVRFRLVYTAVRSFARPHSHRPRPRPLLSPLVFVVFLICGPCRLPGLVGRIIGRLPLPCLAASSCGGADLWAKTQAQYFARESHRRPFLKVVNAIIKSELGGLVEASDLSQWQETLAILSTYAKQVGRVGALLPCCASLCCAVLCTHRQHTGVLS